MPRRYLLGPVTPDFRDQNLDRACQAGACVAFDAAGASGLAITPADTWESVCARFPAGWQPEFIVLCLPYTTVPPCLWSAPVPLIGWAPDWNLLWHGYRRRLRGCDLVLTDAAGVEAIAREGIDHARAVNLSGCGRSFVEAIPAEVPRDIDILFVGNLHPAVQRELLPWLARLAGLGDRRRVVIQTGVAGDDYRALLARSRVVFNYSVLGKCNQRAFEAAGAGALLFQEAGNREVPAYFRDRQECVYYTPDNLESLLDYYLDHEDERRNLADAARARVRVGSFEVLWDGILALVDQEWDDISKRARRRCASPSRETLLDRCWQALSSSAEDPKVADDLTTALRTSAGQTASFHNALGLVSTIAARREGGLSTTAALAAAEHFRRAVECQPTHALAVLNLAEALAAALQVPDAVQEARRALALLDRLAVLDPDALDGGHFPPSFDLFRVEWERAAWDHAGRPAAEAEAKRELLRWRLHALLADLTGDLAHRYEAVVARPDLPSTRIDLGCDLVHANRCADAIPHLRRAVAELPFEGDAPRALFGALGTVGDADGQRRLARDRRLLAQAAPQVVPPEAWFMDCPPVGDETSSGISDDLSVRAWQAPSPPSPLLRSGGEGGGRPTPRPRSGGEGAIGRAGAKMRVSLCMIVKNEEANLPACLESAAGLVDEIIVVDTGSADRTKEVATRFGARIYDFAWVDSFAAARNESLRHATGDWAFWLDADDRIDADNRRRLRDLFAGLGDENIAYVMKCLCLPDAQTGTATVVDHVRLFRNHAEVRWRYRVHEQILPAVRRLGGDVRWTDVVVQHAGYQDAALRGRKLERDLRLLRLEVAEQPDDPFTLFNLGQVSQELGRPDEALPLLRRSLQLSHPGDSIVRKLYALIVQCQRQLGWPAEALATCQAGRAHYPDDVELLFIEGVLRRELGDRGGAEACLVRLLQRPPGNHFASVDTGLLGYKARHNLAVIYHEQGQAALAETQWRLAVAERPDFLPSWQGLAELYRQQRRWPELEQALGHLQARRPAGESDRQSRHPDGCAARAPAETRV